MTLPTFLIIGAPKCGSSALYQHLVADGRVVMSTSKEPGYFNAHFDRGRAWYESQFPRSGPVVGEATVGYLSHPDAPARIAALVPEARLVVLARNPFDRARSHYWWRRNNGTETRSLDEVLADGADAFPVADGLYARNLARYHQHFPPEQVLVLRDTDLRAGTGVADRFWEFIGLTPPEAPRPVGRANEASVRRGRGAALAVRGMQGLRRLRSVVPPVVRRAGARAIDVTDQLTRSAFTAPALTPEQVGAMEPHLLADLDALERMLGLDLAAWRAPSIPPTPSDQATLTGG